MSDAKLLQLAAEMNRAIVTENVPDFAVLASQWAADAKPHAGIVYTNPNRFNRNISTYPANLITALDQFLRQSPIEGHSWVWWLQPPS